MTVGFFAYNEQHGIILTKIVPNTPLLHFHHPLLELPCIFLTFHKVFSAKNCLRVENYFWMHCLHQRISFHDPLYTLNKFFIIGLFTTSLIILDTYALNIFLSRDQYYFIIILHRNPNISIQNYFINPFSIRIYFITYYICYI